MNGLVAALQKMLFQRLSAELSTAKIYQNLPQNTASPIVLIGNIERQNIGGKSSILLRCECSIETMVRSHEQKKLDILQNSVISALNMYGPTVIDGCTISKLRHMRSDGDLTPDGQHYLGSVTFLAFAEQVL